MSRVSFPKSFSIIPFSIGSIYHLYTTYIPLIVLAFWGVICHLPPLYGNQKQPWHTRPVPAPTGCCWRRGVLRVILQAEEWLKYSQALHVMESIPTIYTQNSSFCRTNWFFHHFVPTFHGFHKPSPMEILGCDFLVVGGPVLQCPVENMPSWHLSRLTFTNSTEQPVWTRPFVILLYTGGGEILPSYVVILN